MAVANYGELLAHNGHAIGVTTYGDEIEVGGVMVEKPPDNVAVECFDCYVTLFDFDNPDNRDGGG